MGALTFLHFIYLLTILVVVGLMVMKHDVVIPCIAGLFIIGFCFNGYSVIGGAQSVFNGMMFAGQDLFDIMLVIALMVAMLKSLESMGADRMMIAPAAKLLKTPTKAFWVIAVMMYICATFFWPTPATALVGTILIPIGLKAGLNPMMACMALNLAGHGMALSGDLILQGAPALSAGAANVPIEDVLGKGGILATVVGVVALAVTFIKYNKEIKTPFAVKEVAEVENKDAKKAPAYAKYFAIAVPVIFFAILVRIITGAYVEGVSKIFGGDATALLGGTAAVIMIIATAVDTKEKCLEKIVEYLRNGMMFSIKIFAAVIPIAAFFAIGNPESAPVILGEGAPGFLFDLGSALGQVIPLNPWALAIGIAVVGDITGLDGSGFSGIPLVAGLAAALAGPQGYNVGVLAALGQVAAVWVGGGTLSAWAFGAVASAGVAGVSAGDLVRKNFVPVMCGLAVATVVTVFML